MPDDPKKTDYRDRDRVAGKQDYEARYFAQEAGISLQQAAGTDRALRPRPRHAAQASEPDAEEGRLTGLIAACDRRTSIRKVARRDVSPSYRAIPEARTGSPS